MTAERAVKIFRDLQPEDLRVLMGVELAMEHYEFAPLVEVVKYANLSGREVVFRLGRLDRLQLTIKLSKTFLGYDGYAVNYSGYDCLALNALVKSNILEAIGKPLGIGKEADVHEALSPRRERVAVKFHRLGRTSFRQTRRARGYVAERRHISWLYQSRLAAEREYEVMQRIYPRKVSVPKPIARNRHVVVMGLIEGTELRYAEMEEPIPILKEIIANIRRAYLNAGTIHADLSEFNILIKPDGGILIIDWPQAITKDHQDAERLLTRDVENILYFFHKRYRLAYSLEDVLSHVKGDKRRMRTWVGN
jgi:RIO kinase 2